MELFSREGNGNAPTPKVIAANPTGFRRRKAGATTGLANAGMPGFRYCNRKCKKWIPVAKFDGNKIGCRECLLYDKKCRERRNRRLADAAVEINRS
jgi:hypothetical protein